MKEGDLGLAFAHGEHLHKMLFLAQKSIGLVAEKFGEGRKGGSLYVVTEEGVPILQALIGEPEEGKAREYVHLSYEKAYRLLKYPEHVSSFQSRNDTKRQYPGAVRGSGLIASFSGLPWKVDEGFVVALLRFRGAIDERRIKDIVQTSDNELAGRVYRHVLEVAEQYTLK